LKADRNKHITLKAHRRLQNENARLMAGHFLPIGANLLTHLDVGKFAYDIRRHIGTADFDTWRQALFLIPPAAPLRMSQEPQVLSVRKDAHGDLPNLDCETEKTPNSNFELHRPNSL
jgi:hypothetical protein